MNEPDDVTYLSLQQAGYVVLDGDHLRSRLEMLGFQPPMLPPDDESHFLLREPTQADQAYLLAVWHGNRWEYRELFRLPDIDGDS